MLVFSFKLSNPFPFKWHKKEWDQQDYIYVDNKFPFTTNKFISIQLSRWNKCWTLLGFEFNFTPTGEDHAGFLLSLDLFGFGFIFNIYDNRHWNYDEDRWCIYPEENDYYPESKTHDGKHRVITIAY